MGKWLDGILESTPKDVFGEGWELGEEVKIEKPCHFTGYCVYGTLVEEFPAHQEAYDYAVEHGITTKISDGKGGMMDYPDLNKVILEHPELDRFACKVFGHNCPVFYMAEPLSEDYDSLSETKTEGGEE